MGMKARLIKLNQILTDKAAEKVKAERAVKEKKHNQLHEDITK